MHRVLLGTFKFNFNKLWVHSKFIIWPLRLVCDEEGWDLAYPSLM